MVISQQKGEKVTNSSYEAPGEIIPIPANAHKMTNSKKMSLFPKNRHFITWRICGNILSYIIVGTRKL